MGVPQIYVPSLILLILYINDLNKSLTKLKFIHFADNITLYFDNNPLTDHTSLINIELAEAQT